MKVRGTQQLCCENPKNPKTQRSPETSGKRNQHRERERQNHSRTRAQEPAEADAEPAARSKGTNTRAGTTAGKAKQTATTRAHRQTTAARANAATHSQHANPDTHQHTQSTATSNTPHNQPTDPPALVHQKGKHHAARHSHFVLSSRVL